MNLDYPGMQKGRSQLNSFSSMDISIIIPVYNEKDKIAEDIKAASEFMVNNSFSGEIIVVDDGSSDETARFAREIPVNDATVIRVIEYKPHTGKGFAVKKGILEAVSDYIIFIDSGNCIPYSNIIRGIHLIQDGICDISHGSRYLPESRIIKPKKWYRGIASYIFRKFIKIFVGIPYNLTDTQCGLKIYRKEIAHELYMECITQGFIFDIEIILRAQKRRYRIKEFPIEWTSDPDSRLSLFTTLFSIFPEIRKVKKVIG